MRWTQSTIGEHCTVTSSKRFHLSERSDKGVPFYCSKEIIQKCKGEEVTECDYIRDELYAEVAEKFGVPQENDLLVTTRGTIGIPYLYRDTDRFYFADGNLTWMKDFKKPLLPQYLYYWFLTHEGQGKFDAIAKGTAQKAVPITEIKTLKILLPPVDAQCRIVGILSAYDDLIENNQKQIKLLEEAAQRLYKEWFVDLCFPGHETTPIVDGVPEGWEKVEVGTCIAKVARTKQVMTAELLEVGRIPVVDQSRSFVAGYTNDEETIVDLGIPIIVFGDHTRVLKYIQFPFAKGADGTQLIVTNNEKMPQSLFYCSLVNVDLSNYHYARHFKYLKAEEILLPSLDVAHQFDGVVSPLFEQVQMLRDKCKLATETRDRLLPKLMSGEIEV